MRLSYTAVYVLIGMVIYGCAATPVREAIGTKYTSSIPPLEIEFAYKIGQVKNRGNDKFLTLYTTEVRNVYVELDQLRVNDNQVDYYYSLQTIVKNNNIQYFGPIYFNGHEWAKVADVNDSGRLVCGYTTRKDKWMIFIHNAYELDAEGMERYRKYQKTLQLDEKDKQLIDKLFADLDKAIISIR